MPPRQPTKRRSVLRQKYACDFQLPGTRDSIDSRLPIFPVIANAQMSPHLHVSYAGRAYNQAQHESGIFRRVGTPVKPVLRMQPHGSGEQQQSNRENGSELLQNNLRKPWWNIRSVQRARRSCPSKPFCMAKKMETWAIIIALLPSAAKQILRPRDATNW
jgi:hypothetical protein